MPVRVFAESKLWSAEVTDEKGVLVWHSSRPMRVTELVQALEDVPCQPYDVSVALRDAGLLRSWGQHADEVQPQVEAALDGRREVPPQDPYAEAWITYALFWNKTPSRLEDIVAYADAINHAIPTADELAWAFLRLRERRWLTIKEQLYTLSPAARRTIQDLLSEGRLFDQLKRLEAWISVHPPSDSRP